MIRIGSFPFIKTLCLLTVSIGIAPSAFGHGTVISPASRVYRVRQANPENPNFPLAVNAVNMDGKTSYYTWNQVSRNIDQAVIDGLPAGYDYSPWIPDGQLASAGRVAGNADSSFLYRGLDQVSADWPTTPIDAGQSLNIDFLATAPHHPSVWDVWMTTEDWDPNTALIWDQMEFIGRPSSVPLVNSHYAFDIQIPSDRSGHHVLWVAWQRDDPVGEVFISTSDVFVNSVPEPTSLAVLGGMIFMGAGMRRKR